MSTISPAESLIWSVARKLAEQLERGSSVREVKRVIQAESGGQGFPGNQANIALDNQGLETQGDSSGSEAGHKNMNGSIEKAIQAVRREMEMMFEEAYTTDLGLKKAFEETKIDLEDAWKFIWDRCYSQYEWGGGCRGIKFGWWTE